MGEGLDEAWRTARGLARVGVLLESLGLPCNAAVDGERAWGLGAALSQVKEAVRGTARGCAAAGSRRSGDGDAPGASTENAGLRAFAARRRPRGKVRLLWEGVAAQGTLPAKVGRKKPGVVLGDAGLRALVLQRGRSGRRRLLCGD